LKPSLLLALLVTSLSARAATPDDVPPAPRIPSRTFSITDFGGIGDGKTINTMAFSKTVDVCEKAGGGSVIVPPGVYLTGPFTLGSHMALVIRKGATIQATGKFSDSGLPDPLPATQGELNRYHGLLRPLISASDVTDLAIRGEGVIDGAGAPWWAKSDRASRVTGALYVPRPNLVVIKGCTRLLVSGVTLRNSPYFHLVPKDCNDVLIDGIKVHAPPDSPNTDAVDPGPCNNVLIRHILTDTGDDDIAFKAGGDGPVQNVTVTDCTFLHGHGVSFGSETNGGVRNVLIKNCTFENTGTAIRIKTDRDRGGLVQDVTYRDITMKNVDQAIYINLFYNDRMLASYPQPAPVTRTTPIIRNILIKNITCVNAKTAGEITGLPESPTAELTLENVNITAWSGFNIQDSKGLTFENVSFTTSPKPPGVIPGAFNESPTSPNAMSAVTGTFPTAPGVPGGSGTIPTLSGTVPAASGTVPALSGSAPAASAVLNAPNGSPVPMPLPLSSALKAAVLTGTLTVAADGTGDVTTVQAAVNAAPDEPQSSRPFVIHIKPGTYKEVVTIPVQKGALDLEGDDAAATTITFSNAAATLDADGHPLGTFKSATVFVQDEGFSARNITFANGFGKGSQALAISVSGDRALFRKCRFLGWQDTILLLQGRQYFEDCAITGVTDFIFGAATAFFQHCDIHCLANGYITAASTPQDHPYGFVFANCFIDAAPGVKTFLGRPWRPFASVTYLSTRMSDAIPPEGWHAWNKLTTQDEARYSEYKSTGPGGSPAARVPWSKQLSDGDATRYTAASVLGDWDPSASH